MYRVIEPVRPRKTPSMYEAVAKDNLPVGYEFESNFTLDVTENISGQEWRITFVRLPDGYWIPTALGYTGKTYVIVAEPLENQPIYRHDYKVPATGRYVRLLHDYQTPYANDASPYKPRKAAIQTEVPETIHLNPFENGDFVVMTREIQEWILKVIMITSPDMSREEGILRWHNLTKNSVCFTDKYSWNYGTVIGDPSKNYADYLFGMNLQNPPMRWKMLGFGGNIARIVSGSNVIEAIDYTKPLPSDPLELYGEKPYLFQWATQCYWTETGKSELLGGKMRKQYMVSRFPHFRPVNFLIPIFGAGGVNRIAEPWRMRAISNGAVYSPYVP